ncbi:uncharacterized protein LOC130662538 [Hydractinia symbiolongicarpus]|uniref:uncharacterized protein LOC130662538 n=1 Tax=Hydractinia symbiolongicarpus TaxID=13093 RepID=UPI002549CC66|nr:uncharacterized protein LOC130662538 [Hydractinia symbiolongicarpus]
MDNIVNICWRVCQIYVVAVFVSHLICPVGAVSNKTKPITMTTSSTTTTTTTTTTTKKTEALNSTAVTTTHRAIPENVALRAFYVIAAISALVLVYFILRWICSRRRKNRTRRYGMLKDSSRGDMELHPLSEGDDDDDDDMTLFDVSQQRNQRKR